ncbi:MAG: hypothetical protein GY696_17020 [Gammaproteobacteria bacterium]|nr:hypothetical protein [Gammaproteobacteria bacterium]
MTDLGKKKEGMTGRRPTKTAVSTLIQSQAIAIPCDCASYGLKVPGAGDLEKIGKKRHFVWTERWHNKNLFHLK